MKAVAIDADLLRDICRRYGVASLEVFGSVAQGLEREGSDIDLLYTLLPGARLGWEIDDLADELAGVFGRKVDLVSRKSLHPLLRDEVLREARPVYAAA